ncbi:hypothetical protein ONZ45_g14104 [Pleurotus djamor]|nr:hypothetical protein ONZ45_g14104 [Pleurotus djamor]
MEASLGSDLHIGSLASDDDSQTTNKTAPSEQRPYSTPPVDDTEGMQAPETSASDSTPPDDTEGMQAPETSATDPAPHDDTDGIQDPETRMPGSEVERGSSPAKDPSTIDDDDDEDNEEEENGADKHEENGASGKKKPGKKGDFKGRRLQYLKDAQEAYFKASAEGKVGVSVWYTTVFFPAYFNEFHWAIPWTCDTVKNLSKLPPKDDDALTKEQRDKKSATTKSLKKKIKTWFNTNRNTVRTNSGSNQAWNPWLKKLKEGCRVKPRKPQACQFYMHHPDFKSKVDAAYDKQNALSKTNKDLRMSTRYGIANELLSQEGDKVKERINRELEESHARALAEYEQGVWVSGSPEDREDALNSMTSVVQPLLDGIREITGFHIGFFAAGSRSDGGKEKFNCLSLTSGGSNTKKDLHEVDPQAFSQLVRTFTKIVVSASKQNNVTPDADGRSVQDESRTSATPVPSTPSRLDAAGRGPVVQRSSSSNRPRPATPATATGSNDSDGTLASNSTTRANPSRAQDVVVQDAMSVVRKTLQDGGHPTANEHLLRSIVGLKGQKKAARIAELVAMEDYEFERENNIARNRFLFKQIGVEGELESLLGGRPPPHPESPPRGDDADFVASDFMERQAATTPSSPRKTRSATGAKPVSSSANRTSSKRSRDAIDDDVASPSSQSTAPLSTRSHGKPSSSRRKPSSSSAKKRPDWFETAWAVLHSEEIIDLYGPTWEKILALWEELERGEGFEANGMVLSAANRPKEVRLWIKSARPYHRMPSFEPVKYGKTWWRWWMANNPEWRKTTNDGLHLLPGDTGDWGDHLPATGLNGFLSVLAGLWFWRENASDVCPSLDSWRMALHDVEWVLGQLVAEAREDEDDMEPPQKRLHCDV